MLIKISVEQGEMKVNLEISEQTLKDLTSPVKVTIPEEVTTETNHTGRPAKRGPYKTAKQKGIILTDAPNVEDTLSKATGLNSVEKALLQMKSQVKDGTRLRIRLNKAQLKFLLDEYHNGRGTATEIAKKYGINVNSIYNGYSKAKRKGTY